MEIVYPYIPTEKQVELHSDSHRFKVAIFGRRSGKSTFALNEAIATCLEKPGTKVWIILPTYGQAKDIYWRSSDLMGKFLLPQFYSKKNDTELLVEFNNGSILQLKGSERPDLLRGSGIDLVIFDEVDDQKGFMELWEEIILPALSDKQGRGVFIGTPKGYHNLYKLSQNQEKFPKDWRFWQVKTSESGNPWTLTEDGKRELARLESDMGEDVWLQEYCAEFRMHTGLVFKEWKRPVHVKGYIPDEHYPMECGMDFGYMNPTVVIFAYFDDNDVMHVFDEYFQEGRMVYENVGMIKAQRERYPNPFRACFGDSEDPGNVEEYGRNGWFVTPVYKARDSVITGIDRIRARLKIDPVINGPKLLVHPNCVHLIDEMEKYAWEERRRSDSIIPDTPKKESDHAIDALRYIIMMHSAKKLGTIKPIKGLYKPYTIVKPFKKRDYRPGLYN